MLYDDRPDSATQRMVAEVVLSEYRRGILSIPAGVWHAVHNIASRDAVAVSFPTELYNHEWPDKYRLPIDTPQIPHTFRTSRGS